MRTFELSDMSNIEKIFCHPMSLWKTNWHYLDILIKWVNIVKRLFFNPSRITWQVWYQIISHDKIVLSPLTQVQELSKMEFRKVIIGWSNQRQFKDAATSKNNSHKKVVMPSLSEGFGHTCRARRFFNSRVQNSTSGLACFENWDWK